MDRLHQGTLEKLKSLRERVNWEIEEERHQLLLRFEILIRCWKGKLPDLLDIFRNEEIDWLLTEEVKTRDDPDLDCSRFSLIEFFIGARFKDELAVNDTNGDSGSSLRRTTALHYAARHDYRFIVPALFKIYDRYDVNYTDESGLTHFHAACMSGCYDVVEKFLEFGQEANCLWRETGNTPLHLALIHRCKGVARLLLENGADPNSANKAGLTALHIICKAEGNDDLAEMLFKICDGKNQPVQVDALDTSGRTPLQWAVANLLPDMVDMLLDRGADLSSFLFPTRDHFGERFKTSCNRSKLRLASDAFIVVERLKKEGYEFDQYDALTIMQFFARHGLFQKSANFDKYWYNNVEFTSAALDIMIGRDDSSLSLYDFVRLRPEEAARKFTYSDYFKFVRAGDYEFIPERINEACVVHLCEMMAKGFFRRWTLEPFLELIGYKLPILCCEIIIKQLTNEDLWSICSAVTFQDVV
uniref:PRANC domain-containing protein n=1 Tax=Trichogramma kaykai TaxID=54128 RepID=A0ABD2VT54_9HYME